MIRAFVTCILVSLSSALVSCATTPTGDDDFTIYGEEPEGPGVFSGERGKIVFFEAEPEGADAARGAPAATPGLTPGDADEFEAFKRWLDSKKARDETYREFQQWLLFEEFKRRQKASGD